MSMRICLLALCLGIANAGEQPFAPVPDLPERLPHPRLRALADAQYAVFSSMKDPVRDRKGARIHTGGWILERLAKPIPDELKALLPQPIIDGQPEWIDLYWQTWNYTCMLLRRYDPPPLGGPPFNTYFIDEDYGQYDGCFAIFDQSMIALVGRWAWRVMPGADNLDTMYRRRAPDGTIYRELDSTGASKFAERINPPLMAFTEWEAYCLHGDRERLRRVLPILAGHHRAIIKRRLLTEGPNAGLYRQDRMGCNIEGIERETATRSRSDGTVSVGVKVARGVPMAAWIDLSSQMVMDAEQLALIASAVGATADAEAFTAEAAALRREVETRMWAPELNRYADLLISPDGQSSLPSRIDHIMAYWPPLLAGIGSSERNAILAKRLSDPAAFLRATPYPCIPADAPNYAGRDFHGGVFGHQTYLTLRGLQRAGLAELAAEHGGRYLDGMARKLAWRRQQRRGDLYPISERDLADDDRAQDGNGWGLIGPIGTMLDVVLGIEPDAPQQAMTWTITRIDRHGLANLALGAATVSVIADARTDAAAAPAITVTTDQPITLRVRWSGGAWERRVEAGTQRVDGP